MSLLLLNDKRSVESQFAMFDLIVALCRQLRLLRLVLGSITENAIPLIVFDWQAPFDRVRFWLRIQRYSGR